MGPSATEIDIGDRVGRHAATIARISARASRRVRIDRRENPHAHATALTNIAPSNDTE